MKYLLPLIVLFASSMALAQDAFVTSKTANLRGVPTVRGKKVASLPKSTPLKIINTDGTWYLVRTAEYTGWIFGELIKLEQMKEKPREVFLLQRAEVVGGSAVLRGADSDNGKKTSVLSRGASLDVYGKVGDWYLVQTSDYAGWINEASIENILPRATKLPTTRTGRSLFIGDRTDPESFPLVAITNKAKRTLILTFGGIKYIIKPNTNRILALTPGNYRYTAAGGGADSLTRIEKFEQGKMYSVSFRIN